MSAIGSRRLADVFAKYPAKVGRILKPNAGGDGCDAIAGADEQFFGAHNPKAVQTLSRRKADFPAKDFAKIVFVYANRLGDLLARERLGMVLMEIG